MLKGNIVEVQRLENLLKGKVRRTKAVNDLFKLTIDQMIIVYEKIEKLKDFIELDSFSSEKVRFILENSYKGLKSLRNVNQFTSILLFVDNLLQNYLKVADTYFKTHEELKKNKELLQLKKESEDNYNNFVKEFGNNVQNMNSINSSKSDENLVFELSSLAIPFNSKDSKWVIVDKFQSFKPVTSYRLLREKWTPIWKKYLSF